MIFETLPRPRDQVRQVVKANVSEADVLGLIFKQTLDVRLNMWFLVPCSSKLNRVATIFSCLPAFLIFDL
jgi:hypothetical protein